MASELIVLFGGPSEERLVSVATAQNLLTHLPEARAWFVARDLRLYDLSKADVLAHDKAFTSELQPRAAPTAPTLEAALAGVARDAVFFLGMHGAWGEDGTVQRLLEARGLAFTGSGAQASADAFDKSAAKRLVRAAGVRTAEAEELPRSAQGAWDALRSMLVRHGRVVAKPVAGGSSVGLFHVQSAADAERAAEAIGQSAQAYLCESFVSGTELTVGVVDGPDGARRALPPSEVRLEKGRAFDYEGKYLGKGTIEITPAEVAAPIAQAAQELALTAHRAIGCYGYSRTDVIVGENGPTFLETNTLPGLTKASFIPQQLAAEGTPLRAFLDGQIALARARRG